MTTDAQTSNMRRKGAGPKLQNVREGLRQAAKASGLTQQAIGERMGLATNARKAISRLLNPGIEYDPRLSTLLKFADAVGKPLKELL